MRVEGAPPAALVVVHGAMHRDAPLAAGVRAEELAHVAELPAVAVETRGGARPLKEQTGGALRSKPLDGREHGEPRRPATHAALDVHGARLDARALLLLLRHLIRAQGSVRAALCWIWDVGCSLKSDPLSLSVIPRDGPPRIKLFEEAKTARIASVDPLSHATIERLPVKGDLDILLVGAQAAQPDEGGEVLGIANKLRSDVDFVLLTMRRARQRRQTRLDNRHS